MAKPSLFIYILDDELKKQLLSNEAITQFQLIEVDKEHCWVTALQNNPTDIAFVQADDFGEAEYDLLLESSLLTRVEIILISSGQPNEFVDKAMYRGISYHLRLPLDWMNIKDLMNELFVEVSHHHEKRQQVFSSDLDQFGLLVGSSPVMRRLYRVIRKAADSKTNVFIVGESGSGKELVANTIHLASSRCDQPFIAVNCGALSPELIESELFGHVKGSFTGANKDRAGVFEQAEGGTLFLDEITEMPLEHQVKLLRVLESSEYRPVGSERLKMANVRVIAATNREASKAIQNQLFREDLYFRLAHFPIRVPPLRERQNDIVGLAKHFLAYRNVEEEAAKEISVNALEKISQYSWPGNVRELKHAIERAYLLSDDVIDAEHLILENELSQTQSNHKTVPGGIPLDEVERRAIIKTLKANNGNKSETAQQLGISVKTLYNKLEKYEKAE